MSSRLRLQKDSAAREKAEQKAKLEEARRHEQELFDSLQGTAPGTAVVVAGRPPDDALEDEYPSTSAPAALNTASRGQKQTKQILVSDSDSECASDKSAGGASDFSASEESQHSDSGASSMEDSDEESPPPAKRGKKGAPSTAKASSLKSKVQATSRAAASAPRAAKKEATSKAADAKKTLESGTKQQTAHLSAKRTPCSLREVEETLPMKAQPAAGNSAVETAQSAAAAAAAAITVESAEQPATDPIPPKDHQKPNPSVASEGRVDGKAKVAPSKGQKVSHGSMLPKHMTKGIQINSPGPAYKAPGLKRPQGGKPLHQIQTRT